MIKLSTLYKKHSGGNYFFVYKMRPPWEYDTIEYDPENKTWIKEKLGFIYSELGEHKLSNIPNRNLHQLIKGLYEWKWFR